MNADSIHYEGRTLDYALVDGVIEVALRREPCNEIGVPMLEDLEHLAALLREGRHGAHALLFYSTVERGFSAGADLRELQRGIASIEQADRDWRVWADHARQLVDSFDTASAAAWATLKSVARERRLPPGSALARRFGVRAFLDRIHRVFNTLDQVSIPTVAAVHGVCFGGGFELALTADVIVADKSARFAFPELRLGLIPGFGGIPRLERDLGNAVVRDLLLSGRSLGAGRAHEVGLVGQLVARGKAVSVARRLTKQLGLFDRDTATAAKSFLKPFPKARLEREKAIFCELLTSPAVTKALNTFVQAQDAMPYLPTKPLTQETSVRR